MDVQKRSNIEGPQRVIYKRIKYKGRKRVLINANHSLIYLAVPNGPLFNLHNDICAKANTSGLFIHFVYKCCFYALNSNDVIALLPLTQMCKGKLEAYSNMDLISRQTFVQDLSSLTPSSSINCTVVKYCRFI